jgi:hypothetical protein
MASQLISTIFLGVVWGKTDQLRPYTFLQLILAGSIIGHSFINHNFYSLANKIKEHDMGGTCSMNVTDERYI